MLDRVTKRVRLWKEVEPFYDDQTRGLPKTSESRGTEAILNALVLARSTRTPPSSATDTRSRVCQYVGVAIRQPVPQRVRGRG